MDINFLLTIRFENKFLVEVGFLSRNDIITALQHQWDVMIFERNYTKYCLIPTQNEHLISIYTTIGILPALDQFIISKHVGILRINTINDIHKIIDGLSYSIRHQLIDCIILNASPKTKPVSMWLEIILHIKNCGYTVLYAIENGRMILFDLKNIHIMEEVCLIFISSQLKDFSIFQKN